MTFATLAILLSGVGILITGALAAAFLRSTETGMQQVAHRPEQLPEVMTGRYIAFTGMTLFATLYGDMKVILAWFVALGFMAFADAFIYYRSEHPTAKHMAAGIAASIVVIVALLALRAGEGL